MHITNKFDKICRFNGYSLFAFVPVRIAAGSGGGGDLLSGDYRYSAEVQPPQEGGAPLQKRHVQCTRHLCCGSARVRGSIQSVHRQTRHLNQAATAADTSAWGRIA